MVIDKEYLLLKIEKDLAKTDEEFYNGRISILMEMLQDLDEKEE